MDLKTGRSIKVIWLCQNKTHEIMSETLEIKWFFSKLFLQLVFLLFYKFYIIQHIEFRTSQFFI